MRLLISDNQVNPIAWEISKIEDTMPLGITYFTIKQDLFNPVVDNKELMIADYFKSNIEPENADEVEETHDIKIKFNSPAVIKVGGSYKTFSAVSETESFNSSLLNWIVDGLSDEEYSYTISPATIKLKASKNYNLIGKVFSLNLYYNGILVDSIQVEVVGL